MLLTDQLQRHFDLFTKIFQYIPDSYKKCAKFKIVPEYKGAIFYCFNCKPDEELGIQSQSQQSNKIEFKGFQNFIKNNLEKWDGHTTPQPNHQYMEPEPI